MNFSEFEATINRIVTMSELYAHKCANRNNYSDQELFAQKEARDAVVRDLINWAKEKAQL